MNFRTVLEGKLFGVFRPTQEFFTHLETSTLPIEGLQILTYGRHL